MRISHSKIAIVAFLGSLFVGCKPNENFEERPHLEWRGATFGFIGDSADNRKIVELSVYFTDGDGDVGSRDYSLGSDTCDLDNYDAFLNNYDLFIHYFELKEGKYVEIPPADSCLPFHNILPDLTPTGQNKTLEGDIMTPFDYSSFPTRNSVDSIKFELVLKDRSRKASDRVYSPAIAVPN